jgi:NADH:ubiquinone oxidoreductase subunit 5 (subunit L)/multisubunit Na+/H+ antiporter MnhA subunit
MLWPMGILAGLCTVGALVGLPQIWGEFVIPDIEESNSLHHFLKAVVTVRENPLDHAIEWDLTGRAIAMSALGGSVGVLLYLYQPGWPELVAGRLRLLHQLLVHAYYVDSLYLAVIVRPLVFVSDRVLFRFVDTRVIDGAALMGSARMLRALADGFLKYGQSGLTQAYFFVMVLGGLAVVAWLVYGGRV